MVFIAKDFLIFIHCACVGLWLTLAVEGERETKTVRKSTSPNQYSKEVTMPSYNFK